MFGGFAKWPSHELAWPGHVSLNSADWSACDLVVSRLLPGAGEVCFSFEDPHILSRSGHSSSRNMPPSEAYGSTCISLQREASWEANYKNESYRDREAESHSSNEPRPDGRYRASYGVMVIASRTFPATVVRLRAVRKLRPASRMAGRALH